MDVDLPIEYIEVIENLEMSQSEHVKNGEYLIVPSQLDGERVEVELAFNQVVVETAEYDKPDADVTFTTQPDSVEHVTAYIKGGTPEAPDALELDSGVSASRAAIELMDRAENFQIEEDFICATGLDDGKPVPNQYDAYWVVTKITKGDTVVWKHPNR